jgi:hypothetical protein
MDVGEGVVELDGLQGSSLASSHPFRGRGESHVRACKQREADAGVGERIVRLFLECALVML